MDTEPTSNECIEQPLPGEEVEIFTQAMAREWIEMMSSYAASTQDPKLFRILDAMPEDFRKVGDTHVIVPNEENMTEDMVEASRSLLLYTDVFGTLNANSVRKRLFDRPWVRRNIPKWFEDMQGHLTKDHRAGLAYHLTLAAALNPPAPEEKYFPDVKPEKMSFAKSAFGCKLTLTYDDRHLDITREFESWSQRVEHGQMFDLRINRHQLPDPWRKLFQKNAIEISGVFRKEEGDQELSLENAIVRLGLKTDYVGLVGHTFEKCVKIPKGF